MSVNIRIIKTLLSDKTFNSNPIQVFFLPLSIFLLIFRLGAVCSEFIIRSYLYYRSDLSPLFPNIGPKRLSSPKVKLGIRKSRVGLNRGALNEIMHAIFLIYACIHVDVDAWSGH